MAARKTGTRGNSKHSKSKRAPGRSAAQSKKKVAVATRRAIAKRVAAKKSTASKASKALKAQVKKTVSTVKRKSKSPLERITTVAVQVAHQAQTAVSEGVDHLREMGENIAERVSGT
jgi:hypothetical protein